MTLAERFAAKIDRSPGHGPWGDCHVWTGKPDSHGYGRIWLGGRSGKHHKAHRVAWILEHGEPPPETPCVLHRCDNPPCVREDHLFLGTQTDNIADRDRKGRHRIRRSAVQVALARGRKQREERERREPYD